MSQLNFSIGTFSQCMSFSPQNIKIDNFEDYTLYCIDCENVQQFDTNTLKATSPSVFFFHMRWMSKLEQVQTLQGRINKVDFRTSD